MTEDQRRLWEHLQTRRTEVFAVNRGRLEAVARRALAGGPGRALDIGVGDGWLLRRLAGAGCRVVGLDLVAGSLRALRDRAGGAGLVAGDAGALPFRDASLDIVTASEVLEHLPPEALARAVPEIARVLRPGGRVVATVPAEERLEEARCFCPRCGLEFHRYGHQHSFDRGRLLALLGPHFAGIRIARRYVPAPGLNWAGWISWAPRAALAPFRPVADSSFFVEAFRP